MKNQSENNAISTVVDFSNKYEISNNHFEVLANATPVIVEDEYFNVSATIKVGEPLDIIVTDFIENGFEKDGKVSDMINFITQIDGKTRHFAYAGSSVVRAVKNLKQKLSAHGDITSPILLRITYKGKAKGNNGFSFDSFDIVGLKV
jgi:hypothetical protein